MIAPQILFIASVLSVLWGTYLIGTIRSYQVVKGNPHRRRQEVLVSVRDIVVALAAWTFVFSFVFRTSLVLVGVGDDIAGQIVFYALLGVNFTGSIFAIVSLKYD